MPEKSAQRQKIRRISALACVVWLLSGLSLAQTPAILELRAPQFTEQSAVVNDQIALDIVLLDSQNEEVSAPQDYRIRLFTVLESGEKKAAQVSLEPAQAHQEAVVLERGESRLRIYYRPPYSGFMSLRAEHPELLTNAFFLSVSAELKPIDPTHSFVNYFVRTLSGLVWAVQPETSYPHRLRILYQKDVNRPYFADNKDAAEFTIFLVDETGEVVSAPEDIELVFSTTRGDLRHINSESLDANDTITVTIPAGESDVRVELISDSPGAAQLKLESPNLRVEPEKIEVEFAQNILNLVISKSSVSLIEPLNFTVILYKEQSIDTTVTLTLTQGQGRFSNEQPVISTGQNHVQSRFFPMWPGQVRIKVSPIVQQVAGSPIPVVIKEAENEFVVTWLLALVFCGLSLLGGLAGAWVFVVTNHFWKRRSSLARRDRFITGALSGFLLFVMIVFGLIPATPSTFAAIVLNPFATLCFSMLGGYGGPAIFDYLIKRFGFPKPRLSS